MLQRLVKLCLRGKGTGWSVECDGMENGSRDDG